MDAPNGGDGIPDDEDVDGDGPIDTAKFEATLTPIPRAYACDVLFADHNMTPAVGTWRASRETVPTFFSLLKFILEE